MGKLLDIVLIGLLSFNLYKIFNNYTPQTEVLGMNIPTWAAVSIQVLCIGLIAFKLYKSSKNTKSIE